MPSEQPDYLIVMPSILGGNLRDQSDNERVSDLGQRAQVAADYFQVPVLGVQRTNRTDIVRRKHFLGMPKSYDPSEYSQIVAEEAGMVADCASGLGVAKLALIGVSAGGERGLAHVEAGLRYNSLFVFDPPAMVEAGAHRSFGRWAAYQARVAVEDITGHPNMPNEHRLPYAARGEVSAIEDMLLHRNPWTTRASFSTLARLASLTIPGMENASTRLVIPEHTFNAPGFTHQIIEGLNMLAGAAKSDFSAQSTDMPHRATDDPVRLAKIVNQSAILPPISL